MSQEQNIAFLRRVPLFSGLTEQQIERLAAGSVRRNFPRGRVIVTEGEPSQSLYILLSGRAKVQRSDTEGKEVILAVIGPGECFGEMSLIDDSPRSASVITIDTSDFMAINKESFKSMMLSSPEMSLRIMAGLVRRLREADKKIETLALLDVYEGSGNRGLHRAATRGQGAAARETQQLSGLNDSPHTTETPGGFVPSPVKAV